MFTLSDSDRTLLRRKRLFLLDMDGTLYLGERLFPGALEFLRLVRERGGDYRYLTNNSSRSAGHYVEKLGRLGIAAETGDFCTSVDAAIDHLRANPPEGEIYVMGTASFLSQLRAAGLPVTEQPGERVSCLLLGYDTELTYRKLEDACLLLKRPELTYLATNPDWVCPTEWGYVPDCGSVAWMLEKASGRRPRFLGKPEPDMVRTAITRAGFLPEETLMIGDRLYTDIAAGVNAGVDTLLVLSGESTLEDIAQVQPRFVLQDIRELYDILK